MVELAEQRLSGGAAKAKEYADRIRNGEPAAEVMKGLGDSFREAVDSELSSEPNQDEKPFPWDPDSEEIIPPQYRGMTSEGLDLAWTVTEYQNESITREQKERKRLALAYLLAQEARQETAKMVQEDKKNSAAMANEIRVELGIPAQPIEQPQTVEIAKAALTGEKDQEAVPVVPELKNVTISENDQLPARNFDPSRFELKNENGRVVETYRGYDTYRREIEGRLAEVTVGDRKIKVIFSSDSSVHAGYEPSRDFYTIGPGAVEEFKKDPELFLSSLNHEIAHGNYFSLPAEKQRSLDDLFLANKNLREILMEFAATLYSDQYQTGNGTGGELYLRVHDKNNQETANNILSRDASPGIKDFRSASFELNGSKREIFLSLLITEMISYMSSLQLGESVYQKVAENGRQRRGGQDPRYELVTKMFEAINNSPKIKTEFDGYNLFSATSEKAKSDLLALMEKNG